MKVVEYLMDLSEIGRDRVCLRWVSASEGHLFAEYVNQFSEVTRALGPFDPEKFLLPLTAVETCLSSPRMRWLMGMTIQMVDRGNVYGDRIKEEDYHRFVKEVAEEEYQNGLLLRAMENGCHSVRDMAIETGLPVYTVSRRLGELERRHQACFERHDGRTPKFVSVASQP
jgi:hypothetical protein